MMRAFDRMPVSNVDDTKNEMIGVPPAPDDWRLSEYAKKIVKSQSLMLRQG